MSEVLAKKYIKIYLCILSVFLLLMIPIYITMYQGTKKQILAERYNSLRQETSYLDSQIDKMMKSAELMDDNDYIKKVAAIRDDGSVLSHTLDLMYAMDYFSSIFGLSGEGFDEYLIFRYNPVVITKKTVLTSPQKQKYGKYSRNGMDFDEFRQMLFEDKRGVQYIPETKGEGKGEITCVLKILGDNRYSYDRALIFTLDRNRIGELFGLSDENSPDFAYVMDRYGHVLYQVNYDGEPLEPEAYTQYDMELDGNGYTVFQVPASKSGLYLALGISNATISRGISSVNKVITVYVVIAVLVMIVFSILWARSRARKMGNALEEIERLKQSISENILEKMLINGVYTSRELEDIRDYLRWDMDFYCVLCISAVQEGEAEILETFYQADEAIHKAFFCIGLSTGQNERNYIVRLQEENVMDIGKVSERLREFLKDRLDALCIGISSVGVGMENVNICYRQARLMNRQASYQQDNRIKEYRKPADIREKLFRLNLGNRLYDLISAEEKEPIRDLFQKIRSYACRISWYSENEVMQFFFEIQNPIAQVWDEVDDHEREKSELFYRRDRSIIEQLDTLEDVCCYLCDCIRRNKTRGKNEMGREMIEFVDAHYTDRDMCVSYAAQHFGLKDKYFSVLFKEQTGKNFGVYVEMKRMEKAKQYLLETDVSMSNIAGLIGYNTVDAFYKSFKKVYGLAPGKWKENNRKQ